MKTLTYTKTNNLSQLHDELIAGIANFRRFSTRVGEFDIGLPDTGRVYGDGNTITIVCADDISDAAVQAVIDAHTPA
jgi:hypothetical protein